MPFQNRYPTVNPRLKTHFAIFTSAIFGLFIMLMILEQLGLPGYWSGQVAAFLPLLLTCVIGVMCISRDNMDYFISGRRVPAALNGLAIAAGSIGSTGILGLTGLIFLLGFDGMAPGLGWALGFLILAVFFAPFLRKMGAYTLPGFFALRHESDALRIICALVVMIVTLLILIAEIRLCALAASFVIDMPSSFLIMLTGATMLLCIIAGGMRSLTWSQCAQFIIVILGILVPLIVVAIQVTNLPLPQMTYANLLGNISILEQANGLNNATPLPLSSALPNQYPALTQKPFLQQFGLISQKDFILIILCFMAGTATLPAVLNRMNTTPNIAEARSSAGWALAFVGIILISIPAYAVFTKSLLFQTVGQFPLDQLPEWITRLERNEIFSFTSTDSSTLVIRNLGVARDGVFFILPYAASFPDVLVALTVCAAMVAALAGANAQIVTLGNIISHDLIFSLAMRAPARPGQAFISRLIICLIAILASWITMKSNIDSFKLLAWALSLTGSAFFAPLVLSIWWRGCTKAGALWGMTLGFLTAIFYIWLSQKGTTIFGIDGFVTATYGIPVSFIATFTGSILTSSSTPSAQNSPTPFSTTHTSTSQAPTAQDMIDDLRVPGGEALYDRMLRAKSKRHRKSKL